MNDALVLLVLLAAGVPPLVALLLVVEALFPDLVAQARQFADQSGGRALAVGAVNALFLVLVVVVLFAWSESAGSDLLGLLGVLVAVVLGLGVVFGLAGMAQLVGDRLLPEGSPLRRSLLGALVLVLACLTPLVGWLGLFPYVALRGLGGLVVALARK